MMSLPVGDAQFVTINCALRIIEIGENDRGAELSVVEQVPGGLEERVRRQLQRFVAGGSSVLRASRARLSRNSARSRVPIPEPNRERGELAFPAGLSMSGRYAYSTGWCLQLGMLGEATADVGRALCSRH